MCTSVLKEVASYYKSRNTQIYVCMLDASKAFDRVHYGKLFQLLRNRDIPPIYIRLLLDMYSRQVLCTSWNGVFSDTFSADNGVKQGGILSPILFCIYFDELLKKINDSGFGCQIGHLSYAGLGYADDVTLLTPSLRGLQELLDICSKFAREYNVMFNAKKTISLKIGGDGESPKIDVKLNGTVVSWKKCVRHLGNMINHNLSDNEDVTRKTATFISQVNLLNNKFSSVSSLVQGSLI